MNQESYEKVNALGVNKALLLKQNPLQYIVKAILASFFLGFAVILSFKMAAPFYAAGSPAVPIILGSLFGIGLVLIVYGSAELFTGNTMYFTMSTMNGKTTVRESLSVLSACYIGNLIGAIAFGFFIGATGIYKDPANSQLLMDSVSNKMHYPVSELFFKAILCNWIVCLAVWIPMQMKGDMAKIVTTILAVMAFVVAGFEHSVANMILFSLALVVPHPETITAANALYNLVPVTLGNIIGGSVFVGMVYVYLAKPAEKQKLLKTEPNLSVEISKSRQ